MSSEKGTDQAQETKKDEILKKDKKPVQRSPGYPWISLKKAVERAQALLDKEGRHQMRFSIAAQHWGLKATSSGSMQIVAALGQFGLIVFGDGIAENRLLQLSPLAIRILLDKREGERERAIQEAALKPKLYAELWKKWQNTLPSDASFGSYLIVDRGFNQIAVRPVIEGYKETLGYAGLLSGAILSPPLADKNAEQEEEQEEMETQPQPISVTAPPVPQGESMIRGTKTPSPPPSPSPQLQAGEVEVLRVKLAGGRTVRVLFQGEEPTQSEIIKLIKHLELSKEDYPA